MKTKKKLKKELSRNLIISSIVWASVLLAFAFIGEGSNKETMYILISGFFVEFLRITSFNKSLLREIDQIEN